MVEAIRCPGCGSVREAGSPGDLCPQCLMRLALGGEVATEGSTAAAPLGAPPAADLGAIGPYRLLGLLGEGGMGSVYLAEQTAPIRRRVALKVIKRGMDTKDVIARFESERQALALMSHPHIANVLDAGTTGDGLPYFVMDYVAGIPITEYCDQRRLGSRERLELFEQVCEAVQHAHQKGIIHRDIKPSNVLVSDEEGTARPRIIDFGVSKAINQRLTEKTLFTQRGMIVGTPGYMSPEQADPTALDVDTRTDIYSLGVLLYELMAGVPPFDPKRLLSAGWGEMQRIIREEEPPRPSTRISKLGETAETIANRRRTNPGALSKELRGELDWITLKALEKDPARRYASASELAADVRRHVDLEPVLAGPPSAWYRLSKYARRHRIGVAFAGSVVLLLVAFAVAMAIMARRLSVERDRATAEAATAHEVERFLLEMFANPNPEVARGETLTARELLDRGLVDIDKLGAQPKVQVRLLSAMYESYIGLGMHEKSRELTERALRVQVSIPDADPAITRKIRTDLATTDRGLGNVEDAEKLFRAIYDEEVRSGRGAELQALEVLSGLGITLQNSGRLDEAEAAFGGAMKGLERAVGRDHESYLEALNGMAIVHAYRGDYGKSEVFAREAYERRRKLHGPDSPITLEATGNYGYVLMQLGRYAESEPLLRHTYEQRRRMLGDEHPEFVDTLNGMATLLQSMERYDEAEELFARALALSEKTLGSERHSMAVSFNNLAVVRILRGRWAEALPPSERAFAIARELYPPVSPESINMGGNFAEALAWSGRPGEALEHADRALDAARTLWPDGHAGVARALRKRASVLAAARRYEGAERDALEAWKQLDQLVGPNHTHTRVAMKTLIAVYERWGRDAQAREWRQRLDAKKPGES